MSVFPLNYTNKFEILTAPENWAVVAAGITNVSWSGNEVLAQDNYYDGGGKADTQVTGGQIVGSFSGHRDTADAAQNYIAGLAFKYGNDRKTEFRTTFADGTVIEGECTVANIALPSGDANAKGDFSFEIHFNGDVEVTD